MEAALVKTGQPIEKAKAVLGMYAFWGRILEDKNYAGVQIFNERCDESFCTGGPHGCHCK